jgi:hypothetical protein|tara:strand:+ start:68 stop:241 length:174 start_codon:yes stop_codon:yes gene_type:complete
MDHSTIINRLEVVIDSIEYEEMNLTDAYDALVLIVSDIESSLDYDADFGNVQFEDLD